MVTVPAIAADTPRLAKDPVIAYLPDRFQKPVPFQPTVAIDVGPVIDQIVDMLASHASQFYEWLPYNMGTIGDVPKEPKARRSWLGEWARDHLRTQAERFRPLLVRQFGKERGAAVEFAEAFEPCEYGAPLDDATARRLFPFAF